MNIYQDMIKVVYKDSSEEYFIGKSDCVPAIYTEIKAGILKIYTYKLPAVIDKIFYREISNIDYTQYSSFKEENK